MTKVVFTNGCFDILHPGHLDLLEKARSHGDKLIVGINSDRSVSAVKGQSRPIVSQEARAAVLLGTRYVDKVLVFDELTPENLIHELRPDVLVKGGDWDEGEIVGSDFVKGYGGEVVRIPLSEGFSTSAIVDRILANTQEERESATIATTSNDAFRSGIESHIQVFQALLSEQQANIQSVTELIIAVLKAGKKVLVCGNGGSAADAQHIAAELVGRYETDRMSLPAISLTTDTSALTAIANDFSFDDVFARQVEGLANEGDVLIAISTSGNSKNVTKAIMKARQKGCKIIGLTSEKGRKMAALCDACVLVPSKRTARIQEAHITIAHLICEQIDAAFPHVEN